MNKAGKSNPVDTKIGRPLKWKNAEELQKLIDDYFEKTPEEEWTTTGLALAIGSDRSVLMDYQNRDQFTYTIKTAKLKIQMAYEKDLRRKGRSGDIFALKNFGWSDQQQIDHTTKGESLNISWQKKS